jgi:hypothetical protein
VTEFVSALNSVILFPCNLANCAEVMDAHIFSQEVQDWGIWGRFLQCQGIEEEFHHCLSSPSQSHEFPFTPSSNGNMLIGLIGNTAEIGEHIFQT